mmetsp:Transcript_11838/g.26034  ORF Transcript_11838/g.26034 Transcript_11838/m.26034 type:complete len:229 (+) Transcript_11838:137-823(+)
MAASTENWSEDLFGPKILKKPKTTGVPTVSALKGKKLVALYFSASWCPPCKSFTPLLIDFYNANKEDLEIIFLSSDRDEESFNGYFGKMPWLSSIPGYSSQEANGRQKKLASMFQIQGIPSLIILDAKTGNFITDNARITVMQASNPTSKKELLQTWLTTEAVPIDDAVMGASNGGGGVGSWIGSILMFFARKPMYLFGLLYFAKQGLRYLERLGQEEEGEGDGKEEL